jgi:hypothetical protein
MSSDRQRLGLPQSIVVEPVPTKNPGVYVARLVIDVFKRTGQSFSRLADAHRDNLSENTCLEHEGVHMSQGVPDEAEGNQGVPEEDGVVRAVFTPRSQGDQSISKERLPYYFMVEILSTSASIIQLGKNVKIGEWEPQELRMDEVVVEQVRANSSESDTHDLLEQSKVYFVSKTDAEPSAPSELRKVIMGKLEHLEKAEKEVLGPLMMEYCDLFLYDRSVTLPCTGKGFHEIRTGDALRIKKNPYKVPFALRAEMKRQMK